MVTKEQVIEVLKTVQDPEIRLDVWTLGLIYDLQISDKKVSIKMTFTTPACPYGMWLVNDLKERVATLGADVDVELTFDPPWTPSKEVKFLLGLP